MILSWVFVAYDIDVSGIGANFGSPAYVTFTAFSASALFTTTVVGIWASSTASMACSVPGTEASTSPLGPFGGIARKSFGRSALAYVHGPWRDFARNQRPETR